MTLAEIARYRRHLQRLAQAAVELDDNLASSIRQMAKDGYEETAEARARLLYARLQLSDVAVVIEESGRLLEPPKGDLRLVG